MFVFATQGKTMSFVIMPMLSVGQHPDEPVVVFALFLNA